MKLVKFKQDNCTPCKMLDKFLAEDLGGVQVDEVVNITTGEITDVATGTVVKDEDEAMSFAGEYGIMKTPVLLLLDENDEQIDIVMGIGQTKVKSILSKRGLI